jgi:membrane dipeptidase
MSQQTPLVSPAEANEVYSRGIVVDGLAGTTFDLDAIRDAGVTAAHVTLAAHNDGFLRTIEVLKDYYAALEAHTPNVLLVRSAKDIHEAKLRGKLALILGFQTASPLEDDLTNLWVFAQLGVRVVQLTYNQRNLVGYGCYEDQDEDHGLTYLGKTVVREMNRLGLLVDVSHTGWRTAHEAIELSTAPVVLSHSNPYAKCPTHRNVPDELLKAVADSGGVIGINAHPALCATRPDKEPTLTDYLDILEYTVNLVGIDHVGLGPDLFEGFEPWQHFRWDRRYDELDNPWGTTRGMAMEADIRSVAPELALRGYDRLAIEKILGLNFLRVFEQVWTGLPF